MKKHKLETRPPRWNWAEVISALPKQRGTSMRKLAAELDFSHVYLAKVARGDLPAGAKLKLAIWAMLDFDPTGIDLAWLLLSDDTALALQAFEAKHGL